MHLLDGRVGVAGQGGRLGHDGLAAALEVLLPLLVHQLVHEAKGALAQGVVLLAGEAVKADVVVLRHGLVGREVLKAETIALRLAADVGVGRQPVGRGLAEQFPHGRGEAEEGGAGLPDAGGGRQHGVRGLHVDGWRVGGAGRWTGANEGKTSESQGTSKPNRQDKEAKEKRATLLAVVAVETAKRKEEVETRRWREPAERR